MSPRGRLIEFQRWVCKELELVQAQGKELREERAVARKQPECIQHHSYDWVCSYEWGMDNTGIESPPASHGE